jgi:hypothetical protein
MPRHGFIDTTIGTGRIGILTPSQDFGSRSLVVWIPTASIGNTRAEEKTINYETKRRMMFLRMTCGFLHTRVREKGHVWWKNGG